MKAFYEAPKAEVILFNMASVRMLELISKGHGQGLGDGDPNETGNAAERMVLVNLSASARQ